MRQLVCVYDQWRLSPHPSFGEIVTVTEWGGNAAAPAWFRLENYPVPNGVRYGAYWKDSEGETIPCFVPLSFGAWEDIEKYFDKLIKS